MLGYEVFDNALAVDVLGRYRAELVVVAFAFLLGSCPKHPI